MATPRRGAPVIARPGASPRTRIGALLWWEFRKGPTPLPELARHALDAGYPTLFLPLPLSYTAAFRRALESTAANPPKDVPGRWQADRLKLETDLPVRDSTIPAGELEAAKPIALGILERWAPDSPLQRPWVVELLCLLASSGELVVDHRSRSAASETMEAQLRKLYRRRVELAMAPETGAALQAALEDAHGVKWRPGMWFVPGARGVDLAGAAARYVLQIGESRSGALDVHDDILRVPLSAAEARAGIEGRVEDHLERIDGTIDGGGIRALRTLSDQGHELAALVEANAAILEGGKERLLQRIREGEDRLRLAARALDSELDRSASSGERKSFTAALGAIREAAESGKKAGKAVRVQQTVRELENARKAALADRIGGLTTRLARLGRAAAVLDDPTMYEALVAAVDLVERRAGP